MHPLEELIQESFHQPKEQRRRSSLDNSCLSAQESFMSLIPDIDDYDNAQRQRRYSLNNNGNKITTFLAGLLPPRPESKKDLDKDFHTSNHQPPEHRSRYPSKHTAMPEQNGETSPIETLDLSEYSMDGGDDDDSCDTFCDAEEGEPANRSYIRQDLGASCFWDDDMYDFEDEKNRERREDGEHKVLKSLPQANERIQAALSRVKAGKKPSSTA